MGFFDKILQGLGFEGNNEPVQKKVKKQKVTEDTYSGLGAEYNFNKEKELEKQQEMAIEEEVEKDTNTGVIMKNPTTQSDVQDIIDEIKNGATIIVNLTGFSAPDRIRALDFLAGALYTLGGKLQPLEGNLYLVSSEN